MNESLVLGWEIMTIFIYWLTVQIGREVFDHLPPEKSQKLS